MSCDTAPPNLNPVAVFESNGITFEYPQNWHISSPLEVTTVGDYKVQTVLVDNPQQAPILIGVQNLHFDKSLDELMDLASQVGEEGIADSWIGKSGAAAIGDEIQRVPAERSIAGRTVAGLRTLKEIRKLTMQREAVYEVYTLNTRDSSAWVFVWIAADNVEFWQSAEPGYSRILDSLRIRNWPNG